MPRIARSTARNASGCCSARRRWIAELVPEIPLYNITRLDAIPATLQNFKGNPTNTGIFWNVHEWEIVGDPFGREIGGPRGVIAAVRVDRRALSATDSASTSCVRHSLRCTASAMLRFLARAAPGRAAAPRHLRARLPPDPRAPGGPLAIYLSNPNVRPEDIERLRRALGLDRPLWQQYWSWLGGVRAGRLGLQLQRRPPGRRCASSSGCRRRSSSSPPSIAFALALALPAGIVAALRAARLVRSDDDGAGDCGHFAAGVLVRPAAADRLRDRPRLAPLVGPDDVRRRRAARSPAAPRAAGDGARRRPGGSVVALPARVDDRNARAAIRRRRRGRAASRPAR